MHERFGIYFGIGATECWLCEPDGKLQFFIPDKRLDHSNLWPDFPATVDDEDCYQFWNDSGQ